MPYCVDVVEAFGVARRSAITFERILVAAVCDVALWFVCSPTESKPATVTRQNAATPRARVTSTREKAE